MELASPAMIYMKDKSIFPMSRVHFISISYSVNVKWVVAKFRIDEYEEDKIPK